jgi:hypothetical protein
MVARLSKMSSKNSELEHEKGKKMNYSYAPASPADPL